MQAYNLLRPQPWYRREAFSRGLKAAGYSVLERPPIGNAHAGNVLLIWNRYSSNHECATLFERAGGTVLVAENGYLGLGGSAPKFDVHPGGPQPQHYYALARGWHNGRGRLMHEQETATPGKTNYGPERFAALGVTLKPWRTEGEHVLVCPNRSFGVGAQVMHADWPERTAARIADRTKRKVVIRRHPGNDAPKRSLADDLEAAWACVVWSSGAAVHALAAGIPTYIEAPWQVMKPAAASGALEAPFLPDRLPVFEKMAWAQWTCAEIETGAPFLHLQ